MAYAIQHFSHNHTLRGIPSRIFNGSCEMCNYRNSYREEYIYYCWDCQYAIHEECSKLPQHINHSLHPLHPLTLVKRSPSSKYCYYCDKPFKKDELLTYACDHCSDVCMHHSCASIPMPTIIATTRDTASQDPGGVAVGQYSCHQRPMTLVEHDGSKQEAKCFACQSRWSGPAYSCTLGPGCKNFLHQLCAEMPQKIEHPFHPHHPLTLQVSKPRACNLCCKKNCRLVFCCQKDGCDFGIGIECAFRKTVVRYRRHDHSLSLVEEVYCDNIRCDACEKSYEQWPRVLPMEVSRTRSILFRCMECDFNLHFLCGPLPSTIEYAYHIHPLSLMDTVVEDDSDEYYCDACEEERDPSIRVYYCKDCRYVAHVHCVISKIMEGLNNADNKAVDLRAVLENRWEFDIQATDDNLMLENAGVHLEELTMKDIIDSLTREEKDSLASPFKSNTIRILLLIPSRQRLYEDSVSFNSLLDHQGSVGDIVLIQRYFQLGHTDFEHLIDEIRYYTPKEGLELNDNRYLSQKFERVGGYKIPSTLAPILSSLLHKHGDFRGHRNLSDGMKSVAATLLCITMDKMCRTKIEDVTKDDLKRWYFYLSAIQSITGFRIVRPILESFEELARSFLGLEAIRCEKESVEKLDQKIAELEAELERCKELREKDKGFDRSKASDFMKESFRKACELKLKYAGDVSLSKIPTN